MKKDIGLLQKANDLRRAMTRQEKHLWYDFLSKYPIKIYRQRVIDNFIADFYCHKARLVIEIDGAQHYSPDGRTYDEHRTEILQKYGLTVLRFTNFDIEKQFQGVCYVIDRAIREKVIGRF